MADYIYNSEEITEIINRWLENPNRKKMIEGNRYYLTNNDIKYREFRYHGQDGHVNDEYRANVRISNNFLSTIIDQKISYCLGKDVLPENFPTLNIDINENIDEVAEEASQKSVGWIFFYPDEFSFLQQKVLESEDIIEIRATSIDEKLIAIIRLYENSNTKYAELWTENNKVLYEKPKNKSEYIQMELSTHFDGGSWGIIPFVPLYNNRYKTTDLETIKPLIDAYDLTISDFANNFIDFQELILFIKNYSENVSTEQAAKELMDWLKKYKVINVKQDGSLDIISKEVPYQARKEFLSILRKLIFLFGKGVDIDELSGGSLTNVAIKAHFSYLDMKSNKFIKQVKKYLKKVLVIDNKWNELRGKQKGSIEKAKFIFNKSIIINEVEIIEGCVKSDGIISNRTNVKNHPWVDDVDEELTEIELDKENEEFNENPFKNIGDED